MAPTTSLYLIDAHNLLYRTFYGLPRLSAPDGTPTNAVLGVTRVLLKILREDKPAAIAAVFDSREPTPRHAIFPDYKANRLKAPEDLSLQIPLVKEAIDALGVPRVEVARAEADDIIGTFSRLGEEEGMDVVIISSDKDLYQLVSERVRVRDGLKWRTVGEAEVREAFGVDPARLVDLLALAGDPSDNVPGVPGIGEKTAAALIREYGSLDNLLAHTDRLTGSRRERIEKNADLARICRDLVRIDRYVALPEALAALAALAPGPVAKERLSRLFRRLGFRKLMEEMALPAAPPAEESPRESPPWTRYDDAADLVLSLGAETFPRAAIAFEGGADGALAGVSAEGYGTAVFPARDAADIARLLAQGGTTIYLFDGKSFLRGHGAALAGSLWPFFDVRVAGYLLAPDEGTPSLANLFERHVPGGGEEGGEESAPRLAGTAVRLLALGRVLEEKLGRLGLSRIFKEVDMPLLPVLLRMEDKGIRIDPEIFRALSGRLAESTGEIERKVSALAGMDFNINSPKQLSSLLFEKLGLPPIKKTKTGYSTDMEVLEQLKGLHDIPGLVLEYRTLEKIRSTYVDVLPGLVDPRDGRIHTTFHQTQTATGRLSSSNPNLQNIPVRTDLGRAIRAGFVASAGCLFVGADYSQVELRLLAHLSRCDELIRLFRDGSDIHAATASRIFGVPPSEVTPDLRRKAKVINFGVLYGMSPFGLSRELGIGAREAKHFIDQYFRRYPGVADYIGALKRQAAREGYVATILGRRRFLRDIASRNRVLREAAERMAVNAPIQGSAADIIKLAMIRVDREFQERGMGARLILQVHDELIVEAPEAEAERAGRILREAMEGVVRLTVPLTVSVGTGRTWGEIH